MKQRRSKSSKNAIKNAYFNKCSAVTSYAKDVSSAKEKLKGVKVDARI